MDPFFCIRIISSLNSASAEFSWLKEKTGSTAGNLSSQITNLKEAGYIRVTKKFNNNYPQTICSVTEKRQKKI